VLGGAERIGDVDVHGGIIENELRQDAVEVEESLVSPGVARAQTVISPFRYGTTPPAM
jgi:hypothetical protein